MQLNILNHFVALLETTFMIAIDFGGENGIRTVLIDLAYNIIHEKSSAKIESFDSKKPKKF